MNRDKNLIHLHEQPKRRHAPNVLYKPSDWAPIVKLMGKVSDKELARQFPMCSTAIGKKRRELGIETCKQSRVEPPPLHPPTIDIDRHLRAMFTPFQARYLSGGRRVDFDKVLEYTE